MRSPVAISLFYATAAFAAGHMRHVSFRKLTSHPLNRKDECGTGNTCAEACGPGWITCAFEPYCYNPATMVCCSNGYHCDRGYYCTDAGCCPNGDTLGECGANSVLPTIAPSNAPPPSSSSVYIPSSSSQSFPPASSSGTICTPVPAPATCERSCGPGWKTCQRFPHCFNPGLGQECCADGGYCPKGWYCYAGGHCCRNGEECTASVSLSLSAAPSSSGPLQSASSASVPLVSGSSGIHLSHSSSSSPGPTASNQAGESSTPGLNSPSASSSVLPQSAALAARGLAMEAAGIAVAGFGLFFL